MALEESEVAGGLKAESFADFDVLIAWRFDGFEVDGRMALTFGPEI